MSETGRNRSKGSGDNPSEQGQLAFGPGPDDIAPGTRFLQKPYPLEVLVREVRRLAAA